MKRYDLQVHTDASPCSRAKPRDIVDAAQSAGLDGIAITNHDTLEGVADVEALAPEELTVIPGVEVTTSQGHMLALDVEKVPPKADPLTVIDHIHQQDGIAILSHPFDKLREYYSEDLEQIGKLVDGVEVLNSRCIFPRFNQTALSFAETYDIAVTGASDAHFSMEVGRAFTECEQSILTAIREKATETGGRGGYLSGHVATKLNDTFSLLNL